VLDRIDAWLLRDRLLHANIDAHVFNHYAESAAGEVPFDAATPQVWVDDEDYTRAQAVLDAFRTERLRTGTLRCVRCAEDNPATFELCWKCGGSL
jgi:hypothetical protein